MADDAASNEDVLRSLIGQPTSKSKVVVERGPVQHFADALLSTSPIYHDPAAAKRPGSTTFRHRRHGPSPWSSPARSRRCSRADAPTDNPLAKVLGPLMAKGGLILHGEQEFLYHRPGGRWGTC